LSPASRTSPMPGLEKIDPLPSLLCGKFISFVGAGGKTSLGEYLAEEALRSGKRAAVTTTTRIRAKKPYVLLDDRDFTKDARTGQFIRVGKSMEAGKLTGLGDDELKRLGADYDFVFIEADGAKGRPLKYPAAYEPVIPRFSDLTVVVAGLDALGYTVEEKVFRWELFTTAAGIGPEAEITAPVFLRLFEEDGLMKDVDRERCTVVLNQYDACRRRALVPGLARSILDRTGVRQVIAASLRWGTFCSPVGL